MSCERGGKGIEEVGRRADGGGGDMQPVPIGRERKEGGLWFTGTVTALSTHETKRAASEFKSESPSASVIGGLMLLQADDGWHAWPYPIVFTPYRKTNTSIRIQSEREKRNR